VANKKISALTGATTPLAGTEVLPIVQSSSTVNVSVANLTAGRAITASSLQFGSGSIIDSYEVGTWTPTDVSGAGLSFSTSAGQYVKIGKFVYLFFRVVFPATANASGAAIGGMPFTSGTGPTGIANVGGGSAGYSGIGLTFSAVVGQGGTTMNFFTNAAVQLLNSNFSSADVRIFFVYYSA
jgi:hypothetical protein